MSKNDITVLLVEDELTLAMIIKDTLEENGFTIIPPPTAKKDCIFSLNFGRTCWWPM